ncbi:hypothetical protein FRAAL0828 [Frankia alni ACN14a]|uniref:Uncharacterized protein n=1 Tax=Frankia alni (strain DSM 45986 / CECT 9034 / ACN14a) TaxID=326424 RepID=Q0RSG6_FRAAA|nr:hypothetical protein FRAAL0828 [Frankia alni ACN14a]
MRLPGGEWLLLGAERLALTGLLPAETLTELPALASANANQFPETVLDVPLAVVRLVGDPRNEVVDAARCVQVGAADLTELVEQTVAKLPPVLAELLLNLLTLLLLLLLSHLVNPFVMIAIRAVMARGQP